MGHHKSSNQTTNNDCYNKVLPSDEMQCHIHILLIYLTLLSKATYSKVV